MKKVTLCLGLGLWAWVGLGALPLAEPILGQPTLQVPAKASLLESLPGHWVTWNLQWFPGQAPYAKAEPRKLHEEAVRATLGKIAPQVALLQEVVDGNVLGRVIPEYRWQAVSNFQRAKDEEVK